MKNIVLLSSLFAFLLFSANPLQAQKKKKKVKKFTVEHIIDAPIEKVWAIVGEDYGAIANSHPEIVSSSYINGSLKAEEGAQRVCNFNEKGTRYLKETMLDFVHVQRTLRL